VRFANIRSERRGRIALAFLVVLFALSALVAWSAGTSERIVEVVPPIDAGTVPGAVTPAPARTDAVVSAAELSQSFREAAKSVLPAVVAIQQTILAKPEAASVDEEADDRTSPSSDLTDDPLLREFLDQMRRPSRKVRTGLGSGVIIDRSGLILTNNHVVSGGGKTVVQLHDGRKFDVTEIHGDPASDLAIIKIRGAGDLRTARLGNSDDLGIGDWVLAVGSPFGLSASVTAGIISAKGRGLGIMDQEEFLQTDAAINPGNSGGPLVNLRGEVVGINTAISTTSGGYQGVGFAIPVNLAKGVSRQLTDHGVVRRGYLGVSLQELTPALAEQFGLDEARGVVIAQVHPNSPAKNAGLKRGDVIFGFADRTISSPQQLQSAVAGSPVGSRHELQIVRQGKKQSLEVRVGAHASTAK